MSEQTTAQLVERYNALTEARENIDQQLDWIKTQLRALGAGRHAAGPYTVTVTPSRRLDEAKVAEMYPASNHPQLYSTKPDPRKVRDQLAPAVVETLMAESGEPRVSVR